MTRVYNFFWVFFQFHMFSENNSPVDDRFLPSQSHIYLNFCVFFSSFFSFVSEMKRHSFLSHHLNSPSLSLVLFLFPSSTDLPLLSSGRKISLKPKKPSKSFAPKKRHKSYCSQIPASKLSETHFIQKNRIIINLRRTQTEWEKFIVICDYFLISEWYLLDSIKRTRCDFVDVVWNGIFVWK